MVTVTLLYFKLQQTMASLIAFLFSQPTPWCFIPYTSLGIVKAEKLSTVVLTLVCLCTLGNLQSTIVYQKRFLTHSEA